MRVVVLLAVLILSSTNLLSQELLRPSVTKQRAALEQPAQAKPIAQNAISLAVEQKLDLLKRIQQPIDLVYDETPWREVHAEIERKLGVNIVLTSSARDDSLTEEEPMKCSIKNVMAKKALRVMLQSKNSTFVIQDGVLKIISLDDAEDSRFFTTRFINVRSLLSRIKELEKDRIGLPRKVRTGANPLGRRPMVGPPAKDAKPPQPAAAKTTQPSQLNTAESLLIDLTLVALSHPKWEDPSELRILGGFAVIKCSQSLGDDLENLFAELSFYLSQE